MNTQSDTAARPSMAIPDLLTGTTVQAFESRLAALIRAGSDIVAIECAGLEHVTSSHISLLWNAQCECQSAGVRLQLNAPPPSLRRVLEALDLDGAFSYDSAPGSAAVPLANAPYPADQSAAYTDIFAPTPEGIDTAITQFVQFLSQLGISEITVYELRIVIYEVTTNIMCHSALSPLDRIEIHAQADASGLTMVVSDPGPAFDPTTHEARLDCRQAAKERQTRGFGLAMVRSLVGEMEYLRRDATCNVLTLRKRWSAEI